MVLETVKPAQGKIRWTGVLFLLVTAVAGFVGAPVYLWHHGLSAVEAGLFLLYATATMMAITAGYHRLYAHAAFKAHPVVEGFVLFFGAAAFEQSALRWASLHRTHHRYVDTDRDPYNIRRGFIYAHMGWIMSGKPSVDYGNAADLQRNKLVMFQHRHYRLLAVGAGLVLPLAVGAATGHFVGTLLLGIAARLALVHHCTFFINSFAHSFGTAQYDPSSSAKDNWVGAFLTNGEGYHNYHHRFPSDYRNGIRWYHWDPTKWLIWSLAQIRLVRDLNRTPLEKITEARTQTQASRAAGKRAA